MRNRPANVGCCWLLAALLGSPGDVSAQITQPAPEAENPQLQQLCPAAVEIVLTGEPDSLVLEAQRIVYACEVSGGPAVARIWQDIDGSEPDPLSALVHGSLHVRDARVFDAIIGAVQNPTRSDAVRLAGLQVLVNYFDSDLWVGTDDLESAPVGQSLRRTFHVPTFPPGIPLPEDAQAQILVALGDMSASDPSPQVRAAALFLRQAFAHVAPDLTPINAGDLGLELLCASNVRVTNTSEITLPITLHVVETGWKKRLAVAGAKDVTYIPDRAGTLQLLYGDQVIESVQLGATLCLVRFDAEKLFLMPGQPTPPEAPFAGASPRLVVISGVIRTTTPCQDIDATLSGSPATATLDVVATPEAGPCRSAITWFKYFADVTGFAPGPHTMTVVHSPPGGQEGTFEVEFTVPD